MSGSEGYASTTNRSSAWPSWSQCPTKTKGYEPGLILPVIITVYQDKSFSFILKTPPAAVLIKKALGLQTASGTPNKTKVGTLTDAQLTEIAKTKFEDLNANDMDAAKRIIAGTARSMGVEVEK